MQGGPSDGPWEDGDDQDNLDNNDNIVKKAELVLIKAKLSNKVVELSKSFPRFTFLELIAYCGIDAKDKTPENYRTYCKYEDAFNLLVKDGVVVLDLSRDVTSTELVYKLRTLH